MISKAQSKSHLSFLVDQLWKRSNERATLAEQLVADLNDADWLLLATWDFALKSSAFVDWPPGSLPLKSICEYSDLKGMYLLC